MDLLDPLGLATWPTGLQLAFAALFGLILGSFLNVVIYRLPLMLRRSWGETDLPQLSLSWPASHCPQCQAQLHWYNNLPLLSWLLQKGRCSACQQPISLRYPLVELLAGLLAVGLIWRYGFSLQGLALTGFALTLLALAAIDAQTRLLPDHLTLPLLWAGLIYHWLFSSATLFDQAFAGALWGYLSLWSLYWVFRLLTGREGMGFGDFKLLAALGAWLGAPALVPVILLASLSGLITAALGKATGQMNSSSLPFGPHLVVAALALLLGGRELAGWLQLTPWLEMTRWAF
ncbi:prepilin peptidase [Marinospirillum perlucidum]|uniref:prepilin peptidase n=1 Tax=Marinospirillum perlucidum TaxID=1982602 RepID=UPI000DF196BD|nr:A24 family peptidase [Marinospirillum perlucidum]